MVQNNIHRMHVLSSKKWLDKPDGRARSQNPIFDRDLCDLCKPMGNIDPFAKSKRVERIAELQKQSQIVIRIAVSLSKYGV